MRRIGRTWTCSAALSAMVALAACGDSGKGTGPNGGSLTLEQGAAASKRIGAGADTLRAASSGGVRYSLGFDSASVMDTVTVRMTPVTAAASGPLHDAKLIAAVRMEPSGTVFAHPARLVIELPAGINTARLAGFLADGDGSAPHLVPVRVDGNKATLLVPHFSVAGLVDDASQIPAPSQSAGSAAAQAHLADYIWSEVSVGRSPRADSMTAILRDWYTTVVRPELIGAAQLRTTDLAAVAALDEVDTWASQFDVFNSTAAAVRQGLASEIADARRLSQAVLLAAIARANQTCLAQPTTLLGMTNAMRAANNAFFWDFFGGPPSLSAGPAMPLQALVDSLCVKINYMSVTFPQQVQVGQTVPLVVRAGMLLGTQPVTTTDLLDIDVLPAGAIVATGQPASGGNDASGFFSTQLTIQQGAAVIDVHSCANTQFAAQQLPYLQFLCKDTLLVRNTTPGGNDLSGPWTGVIDFVAVEATVTHDHTQNTVAGTYVSSATTSFGGDLGGFRGSFSAAVGNNQLANFSLNYTTPNPQHDCDGVYTATPFTTVTFSSREIDGDLTGPTCNGTTQRARVRWVRLSGVPLVQGDYVCDNCGSGVAAEAEVFQFGDSLYIAAGPGAFAARLAGNSFTGSGITSLFGCVVTGQGCRSDPTMSITGTIGGGSISGTITTPQGTVQLLGTRQR